MPNPLRSILAACLLLANLPLHAGTPREQVNGVAAVIEENYFDASRAARIATDLRSAAARGEFDTLRNPRELATALTARLEPHDRHFNVQWSAPSAAPTTEPALTPAAFPPARGNYGVRRVEVLPGNIGYLDLRAFADFAFGEPDQPARRAIEAALQLLVGTDALIIDLRDNGGGSPAMVGYLGSAFAPAGANIYNTFHSRQGTRSEAPLESYPSPRLTAPLYVLTSGRTGSAAEAFAYTLKNARRATIVGEATSGAANPGGEIDAGDGFRVFVSFASPVSPITGRNWEGSGVAPDIAVDAGSALDVARAAALQAVLDHGIAGTAATDTRWALEGLRAEAAPRQVALAGYVGAFGAVTVTARDGRLLLRRERRPAWVLVPLGDDLFTVAGEPSRRVYFERDGKGALAALEIRLSNGQVTRHRR